MNKAQFPESTQADIDAFRQFCRDGDYLDSIWVDMLQEH